MSQASGESGDPGTPDVFGLCVACARMVPHSALDPETPGDPHLICLDDDTCKGFNLWVSSSTTGGLGDER